MKLLKPYYVYSDGTYRVKISYLKERLKHFSMVSSVGYGWVDSIRSYFDFIHKV